MGMESLNCRCCGGVLNVKSSLCVCKYCGTTNFISDVASKYVNQLNRANKLRQEREFDNAARIYDTILLENDPTSDILWFRTLCEYGIEYVPDPVTDKYFPTLHRIKDESILDCDSFKQAIELCDGKQKETLLEEAKYINDVQTKYLNIAANEDPYDVFICYKETDLDTGDSTEDVKLAEELYFELTIKGYKVFFAKETLKEKLSVEYEPYIFAALKSAKAMAVIGTKAEYFASVWVKNEWGRFLKLMEKNPEKQMFFACNDPEELPRAFAGKQAQLLGNDNAIRNLADNIDNFLNNKEPEKILPKINIFQEEFDEILEAKTREYVKDFRNTELGKKKKDILDNIEKFAAVFDKNNNISRWTFMIGSILFMSGYVICFILYFVLFDSFGYDGIIIATLLALPFIIAGIAILLSYNWLMDLITVAFVVLMLLLATYQPIRGMEILPLLTVFAPVAAYIITSQLFDGFNKNIKRRNEAGLEIEKELEELKKVTDSASNELSAVASKLLRQYKEENVSVCEVKIHDDDYFKALNNFNFMYESAKEKYTKYVDVSHYTVKKSKMKEESKLSIASLVTLLVFPLTFISFIVAILDIFLDKYKEKKHKCADWTLAFFVIVGLGAIVGFLCVWFL